MPWQKTKFMFNLNALLFFLPEPNRNTQTISAAKNFRQKEKKKTISSDPGKSLHDNKAATKHGEICISRAVE